MIIAVIPLISLEFEAKVHLICLKCRQLTRNPLEFEWLCIL